MDWNLSIDRTEKLDEKSQQTQYRQFIQQNALSSVDYKSNQPLEKDGNKNVSIASSIEVITINHNNKLQNIHNVQAKNNLIKMNNNKDNFSNNKQSEVIKNKFKMYYQIFKKSQLQHKKDILYQSIYQFNQTANQFNQQQQAKISLDSMSPKAQTILQCEQLKFGNYLAQSSKKTNGLKRYLTKKSPEDMKKRTNYGLRTQEAPLSYQSQISFSNNQVRNSLEKNLAKSLSKFNKNQITTTSSFNLDQSFSQQVNSVLASNLQNKQSQTIQKQIGIAFGEKDLSEQERTATKFRVKTLLKENKTNQQLALMKTNIGSEEQQPQGQSEVRNLRSLEQPLDISGFQQKIQQNVEFEPIKLQNLQAPLKFSQTHYNQQTRNSKFLTFVLDNKGKKLNKSVYSIEKFKLEQKPSNVIKIINLNQHINLNDKRKKLTKESYSLTCQNFYPQKNYERGNYQIYNNMLKLEKNINQNLQNQFGFLPKKSFNIYRDRQSQRYSSFKEQNQSCYSQGKNSSPPKSREKQALYKFQQNINFNELNPWDDIKVDDENQFDDNQSIQKSNGNLF